MPATMTKPMTNKQRSKEARQTSEFKRKMLFNSVGHDWIFAECRCRYGIAMDRLQGSRHDEFLRELYQKQYRGWVKLYGEMVHHLKIRSDYQGSNVMNLPN